jgi:hypothetical protein
MWVQIANNVEMRRQDDLAAFDRLMCTVSQFVQLHGEEQHAEQVLRQRDFAAVIRSLAFLQQLFAALDVEEDIEQRVVRVLETETCILREKLFFELGECRVFLADLIFVAIVKGGHHSFLLVNDNLDPCKCEHHV